MFQPFWMTFHILQIVLTLGLATACEDHCITSIARAFTGNYSEKIDPIFTRLSNIAQARFEIPHDGASPIDGLIEPSRKIFFDKVYDQVALELASRSSKKTDLESMLRSSDKFMSIVLNVAKVTLHEAIANIDVALSVSGGKSIVPLTFAISEPSPIPGTATAFELIKSNSFGRLDLFFRSSARKIHGASTLISKPLARRAVSSNGYPNTVSTIPTQAWNNPSDQGASSAVPSTPVTNTSTVSEANTSTSPAPSVQSKYLLFAKGALRHIIRRMSSHSPFAGRPQTVSSIPVGAPFDGTKNPPTGGMDSAALAVKNHFNHLKELMHSSNDSVPPTPVSKTNAAISAAPKLVSSPAGGSNASTTSQNQAAALTVPPTPVSNTPASKANVTISATPSVQTKLASSSQESNSSSGSQSQASGHTTFAPVSNTTTSKDVASPSAAPASKKKLVLFNRGESSDLSRRMNVTSSSDGRPRIVSSRPVGATFNDTENRDPASSSTGGNYPPTSLHKHSLSKSKSKAKVISSVTKSLRTLLITRHSTGGAPLTVSTLPALFDFAGNRQTNMKRKTHMKPNRNSGSIFRRADSTDDFPFGDSTRAGREAFLHRALQSVLSTPEIQPIIKVSSGRKIIVLHEEEKLPKSDGGLINTNLYQASSPKNEPAESLKDLMDSLESELQIYDQSFWKGPFQEYVLSFQSL